jgi:hypothetical protein
MLSDDACTDLDMFTALDGVGLAEVDTFEGGDLDLEFPVN